MDVTHIPIVVIKGIQLNNKHGKRKEEQNAQHTKHKVRTIAKEVR